MKKTNLVVLKTTQPLFWEGEGFLLNQVYRCLTPTENECDSYLIYGFWFTQEEFDLYFEFAYDRVMRDWDSIGLIKDGKTVSFAEFKRRVDVHTYGNQLNNVRIGFAGIPKENFYKFYPPYDGNKEKQLRQMYDMYQYTIDENMYYLDNHGIQFGTFGIHATYVRK